MNASRSIPLGGTPARASALFALALMVMVFMVAATVFIALQEPSVGWRFAPDPQGQGVLAFSPTRPLKISERTQAIEQVIAVRSVPPDASTQGQPLNTLSLVAVEAPSMLPRQEELQQFFDLQQALWRVLEQARQSKQPVELQLADGRWVQAEVHGRLWDELGWLFWVPLLCAVVPFVVGLGIGIYRWNSAGARFLGLASMALFAGLCEVSLMTGRLWVVAPWMLEWGQVYVRCTSLAAGWAFLMLMTHYPTPVRHARRWTVVSGAMLCVLVVLNAAQWPDSQTLRYKVPFLAMLCCVLILSVWQGVASRADPVHRAAARWLGASVFLSVSVVAVAFAVSVVYNVQIISTAYRWLSLPLLFISMVLSVGRNSLFELERWWVPLCLWYLGGVVVVLTDLALVALLHFDPGAAISLSLVLIGWIYFPSRQWLLSKLRLWSRPGVMTYVPDLIGAVNAGLSGPLAAHMAWRGLLERVFEPARTDWRALSDTSTTPAPNPSASDASPIAWVEDLGRQLHVKDVAGQGVWVLVLAMGGRHLFTQDHVHVAGQLWRLLEVGLAQQRDGQQAVEQERQRIASDLHDDLGAQLLTIVHAGNSDRTAGLARRALDDMRESVRGLAGQPVLAEQVLFNWRAEMVGRLMDADLGIDWHAGELPAGLVLSSRVHVQLTRVLREAVSNVIRHSQARHCRINVALDAGYLVLDVQDDGQGLPVAVGAQRGHGMANIEARVRKLGGTHHFCVSPLGGVHLHVRVLLDNTAQTSETALVPIADSLASMGMP